MKRVVVVGDGAVGTGFSVALSNRGLEVELVGVRGSGSRELQIKSEGAIRGEATVRHREAGEPVKGEACVVAVKAYHLADVAPFAGKCSDRILCACNGMGLEAEWGPGWAEEVESVVLTLGFRMIGPGHVSVSPGEILVEPAGTASLLFRGTGLPVVPIECMNTARWAKWLVNSVINPLGALSGAKNNELPAIGLGSLIRKLFTELQEIIPAKLRPDAVARASIMLDFLTSESFNRCSMLQDFDAGRRTEIDFLTGLAEKKLPGRCPTALVVSDLVKARYNRTKALQPF